MTEELSRPTTQSDVLESIADPELRESVADAWSHDEWMREHPELQPLTGRKPSVPMPADDSAQVLISMPEFSVPEVFRESCYICRDPEFAQMGLQLCTKCRACGGHVPADDVECDDCGVDQVDWMDRKNADD